MKFCLSILLIAILLTLNVQAQKTDLATKHFEKAGLAFDYPIEWKLTDNSVGDVQYFTVASEGSTVQISILSQTAYPPCDFKAESKTITDALLERIARQIHAATPLQAATAKIQIGSAAVDGIQIHGVMNNQRVTGEVYSLRLRLNLVNLVYLRADNDLRGQAAWETLLRTLTVVPSTMVIARDDPDATESPKPIKGGILNGKALHLEQPPYPVTARQAHVSGTVVVKVLIDETGRVIAARVLDGHPLLQTASLEAARASRFSPTKLCGEVVRVTGEIQYRFVAQT